MLLCHVSYGLDLVAARGWNGESFYLLSFCLKKSIKIAKQKRTLSRTTLNIIPEGPKLDRNSSTKNLHTQPTVSRINNRYARGSINHHV